MSFLQQVRANQISIHALREEGDTLRKRVLRPRQRFLSTPSARRATMCLANIDKRMKISIHALREEGDKELYLTGTSTDISIHALREEGDQLAALGGHGKKHFYPRPPRGGRPPTPPARRWPMQFLSTPSARRATTFVASWLSLKRYFYPRPPRGGRHRRGHPVFL